MHLETAGEGPTNQVLQNHKSIASAKSIAVYFLLLCCYFAAGSVSRRCIFHFLCVYVELLKKVAHVTNDKCFLSIMMESFIYENAH